MCFCPAPSDHPQNITSEVRGPTSFRLSWQPPPPEYHHGEIQVYVVNVTEEQTGRMFHLISETAEIVVMDLHPYYLYSCRVAAVTVDVGPHSAATTVRTAEDGMIVTYIIAAIAACSVVIASSPGSTHSPPYRN